jgi:hypothetical protein
MIKKTNKKNNTEKPVAKFDQSKEVVANVTTSSQSG